MTFVLAFAIANCLLTHFEQTQTKDVYGVPYR